MNIRKAALATLIVFMSTIGISWQPVNAATLQEPAGLKNVTVWVNSEYDRPQQLLVMIEGKIDGISAPALVRFLVPTGVEMFSAGSKNAQGQYNNPYGAPARKASTIPGWDEISFQIDYDIFRMEYYDSNVITGEGDKKVNFDIKWLYPVKDMSIVVQQPAKAKNFAVEPEGIAGKDGEGLSTRTYYYASVSENDPLIHFDISYTKTDQGPSIKDPVLNSGVSSTGSAGSKGSANIPLILITIALLIGVLGTGWVIFANRKPGYQRAHNVKTGFRSGSGQTAAGGYQASSRTMHTSRANRKRGKSPSGRTIVPPNDPGKSGARFCGSCGEAVEGQSKFCPFCGNGLS